MYHLFFIIYNTNKEQHIDIGINAYPLTCYHDDHMDFQFYRFACIVDHAGQVKNNIPFVERIGAHRPNAIVFSSFAWNLLNSQKFYCSRDKNLQSCLCHHDRMRQPMCIGATNSHEYNRALTPWCDHAFLLTWRTTFTKVWSLFRFEIINRMHG